MKEKDIKALAELGKDYDPKVKNKRTTIKLDPEVKEELRQYKLSKSKVKKKDLTYNDAVQELLEESKLLSQWMGTKEKTK